MKTPSRSAATFIYAASAPELEQVTGRYLANTKIKTSSPRSTTRRSPTDSWTSAPNWCTCRRPPPPDEADHRYGGSAEELAGSAAVEPVILVEDVSDLQRETVRSAEQ